MSSFASLNNTYVLPSSFLQGKTVSLHTSNTTTISVEVATVSVCTSVKSVRLEFRHTPLEAQASGWVHGSDEGRDPPTAYTSKWMGAWI